MADRRRVFFALRPDAVAQQALTAAVAPLVRQRIPRLRWLDADDWHVTLRFVGDVEQGVVDALLEMLTEVAPRHGGFPLALGEVGPFPSPRRPVVLAATGQSEEGAEVAQDLEARCRTLGLREERRPWRCHMSLARIRGRGRMDLEPQPVDVRFGAGRLRLMESVPGSVGRRYVTIADAPFSSGLATPL